MAILLVAVNALAACAPKPAPSNQAAASTPPDSPATNLPSENATTPIPASTPTSRPEANADAVLASLVGTWRLVSLNGQDITPRVTSLSKPPTITFAADAGISGFAGVNRFTGRLDKSGLANGTFKTSPLAMTRMAGPPEAMQLEGEFATALSKATAFRLDGDTLELLAGTSPLATFEPDK
jgi:heat shock protein HslJ